MKRRSFLGGSLAAALGALLPFKTSNNDAFSIIIENSTDAPRTCTYIGGCGSSFDDPASWLGGIIPRVSGDSIRVVNGAQMFVDRGLDIDTLTCETGCTVGFENGEIETLSLFSLPIAESGEPKLFDLVASDARRWL